ncbi:MAG: hypothetical protein JRF33_01765 [Deltaproteobacteria bacterium]|nr:hypothetical protein [Deltaproteobacteria bacterium]
MIGAFASFVLWAIAANGVQVQARMQADIDAGKPLVAHVIVALCDNVHQGIVPVKPFLGNGEDFKNNLYWGALYGVKRFLKNSGGWKQLSHTGKMPQGVLDRIVLVKKIKRNGKLVEAYVVAEAWQGSLIKEATGRFLNLAAGHDAQKLTLQNTKIIEAGGLAHLIAYIGHDGLMEFDAPVQPEGKSGMAARSAIVLACMSKQYFKPLLDKAGAHALTLTTNLMPPEAYTLDATLKAWFEGKNARQSREAGNRAFVKYQKCSIRAARRLFTGDD